MIDKGKYFNCIEDDVDKVQSDLNLLDAWNQDATEQMKITVDTDVLENVYSDAHASNIGLTAGVNSSDLNMGAAASPLTFDKTNILDTIVDSGTVLDEQNVPETGRWLTFPPLFIGMIKKSDLKDASLAGDATSIMRNGRVGQIDRYTLFSTNNLLTTTDGGTVFYCLFGHPYGLTFASQMTNMESLRAESTFGSLIRGLQVYGYKVNYSVAVGYIYARKA